MNQGRLIEYIEHGKLSCALCMQDKGGKLYLITLFDREVTLNPNRTLLKSHKIFDVSGSREDSIKYLRNINDTREKLKTIVDIKNLWLLVHDEPERFSLNGLAQLAFSGEINDNHESAVMRALLEEHVHFKLKDNIFIPNSSEQLEKIQNAQKEEKQKLLFLKEGGGWLKGIVQGYITEQPDCKNAVIDILKKLAVFGNNTPEYELGRTLLASADIHDHKKVKEILIFLGEWNEDENLELIRSNIPIDFTEQEISEAERIASSIAAEMENREDLRNIPTVTIDGDKTTDFDDAISIVQIDNDNSLVLIHITDIASIIKKDSLLDKTAMDRCSSHYLPDQYIPMLPKILSEDILSLCEGNDRYAISVIFEFDKNNTLLQARISKSIINVDRRMNYNDINIMVGQDRFIDKLYSLCLALRRKRTDADAMHLSLPEVNIEIDDNKKIFLEILPQNTPAKIIVEESMILYNSFLANFCNKNNIPALYRTQSPPSERISICETNELFYTFRQLRKISPLRISTTPRKHSGLGIETYIQCTSPLRRYLDLVMQRQITTYLSGDPTLTVETLEYIRMLTEPTLKTVYNIKRNRQRYWIIKYLCESGRPPLKALMLDEFKNYYKIVLTDFMLTAEIKKPEGVLHCPGDMFYVKVSNADPWEDTLSLFYVGSE